MNGRSSPGFTRWRVGLVCALLARRSHGLPQRTRARYPARPEIASLEDRLAVRKASQSGIDAELERPAREGHEAAAQELDLMALKEEIAQMEGAARKIGVEVEALNIEIQAPPRIRSIDDAAVPGR